MSKITLNLERSLYDADMAISRLLEFTKELSHAEFHELKVLYSEFDILKRALEKRK
jgi:hypothetical protein